MDESDQLDAKIAKGNNGKIPSRIQTLDLGESFESISSRIQSMGLDDATCEALEDKIEAAESDGNDDSKEFKIKKKEEGRQGGRNNLSYKYKQNRSCGRRVGRMVLGCGVVGKFSAWRRPRGHLRHRAYLSTHYPGQRAWY